MIALLVGAMALVVVAAWAALVAWLGWLWGTAVNLGVAFVAVVVYRRTVRSWHLRWGASGAEVARVMPGDELLPDATSATRAITIEASPEAIWPWLVQLGYGKAGWYSYDWIDNDFKPSADRILPEYQDLNVGDSILMMPGMGFEIQAIDEPNSIVSLLGDGSTSWCLGLYRSHDGSTRLVSRWRPRFERSVGNMLMLAVVEPGTFIMEQKMLRTIRDRVEAAASPIA